MAPFKSQNMALNSYITKDGFEMGRTGYAGRSSRNRARCQHESDSFKTTSDVGSQVDCKWNSVKKICRLPEYFKYKTKLIPDIMNAYEKLDKAYDVVVIEGAGSPCRDKSEKKTTLLIWAWQNLLMHRCCLLVI